MSSVVSSFFQPPTSGDRATPFEFLENRQMLTATLTPGQFTLLDSTTNNGAVVFLGTGSTNVTNIVVSTTNDGVSAGNDRLDGILVTLGGAGPYDVRIQMANIAGSTPNITFTGGAAGAQVTLGVYDTNVSDAVGGGFGNLLTGATSGYTATAFVADTNGTVVPGGMVDGVTLASAGNIGTVNLAAGPSTVATLQGGTITLLNSAATGNVGLLTLPNIDVSVGGAANEVIASSATGAATTNGGVTAGNVTLGGAGNRSLSITTEANTTVGNAGAQVTLGTVTMGATNATGGLTITSPANTSIGAVTVGNIITQGTGGAGVSIAPTGTANIGAVALGTVAIGGTSAANIVQLGSATTTFLAGITTGAVTNTSSGAGANFAINAAAITGTVSLASYTLTNTVVGTQQVNTGNFTVTDLGALGGFTVLGALNLGDTDATAPTTDTGAFTVSDVTTTGAINLGTITTASNGNVAFTLDSGGGANATASIITGNIDVDKNGLGTGSVTFNTGANAAANITGGLTLGNIATHSSGVFSVTTGGNVVGATIVGNVSANDVTGGVPFNTGNVTFSIGGTAAAVGIGNIALGNLGEADTASFSFTTGNVTANAANGIASLTVGTIATNGTLGSTVTFNAIGATSQIGAVVLGATSLGGTAANNVTLGSATTTFTAGVTIGAMTNTSSAAGASFTINALAITGTVSLSSYTLTNTVPATPQINTGNFVVADQGNLGGFTVIGALTLGDTDASLDSGSFTVTDGIAVAGGTTGAILLGTIANASSGSVVFDLDSSDAVAKATASIITGNVDVYKTGNVTFDTGADKANNITGVLTIGNIATHSSGQFSVTTGGNIGGTTTVGNVSANDVGVPLNTGNITFLVGGTAAAVQFGNVALGNTGEADSASLSFTTGNTLPGNANAGITGLLTVGSIATNGTGGSTVTFDTNGTGAIGGVTLGAVTIDGSSANSVSIGHDTGGAGATANLGNVSLQAVTINGVGGLNLKAQQVGNVTVTGQWSFSNSTAGGGAGGSVTIEAYDHSGLATDATHNGAFASPLGASTWNIDFFGTGPLRNDVGGGSVGGINLTAADGFNNIEIGSVDHFNPAEGFIRINGNADAASELATNPNNARVGAIGNITIDNPGDNSVGVTTPGNWFNVEWGTLSWAAALSIGNISIAGGAEGKFVGSILPATGNAGAGVGTDGVPVAHTGGAGTVGTVTLAGQSNGLWVVADDGTGAITINNAPAAAQNIAAVIGGGGGTLLSTATGITVNANNDRASEDGNGTPGANVVGSVGAIHSVGASGLLSLSGTVSGVAVGNITLDAGDLSLAITAQGGVAAADRNALNASSTSNIGNITVSLGSIVGGNNYIADTNIGNISATSPGLITLGTVQSDAVSLLAAPNNGTNGTIGTITAASTLSIGTLQTHNPADNTFRATQNVGVITAGNALTITHVLVGGNAPTIHVVRASTAGAGSVSLPDLNVNGSVDTIASGLLAGDSVAVTGTIRGDLNRINAGIGLATLALEVKTATRTAAPAAPAAPLFVITQGDNNGALAIPNTTDYILSLSGTWTAGATPVTNPSMDVTVAFDGTGIAGVNTATINNMQGVTSVADSILALATRANATAANVDYATNGLGTKSVASKFSLAGFQDSYNGPGTDKGRNSFKQVLVEGNLVGGIGSPGLTLANASADAVLASNAPILGDIGNLEISGNWANPAVDNTALPRNSIFVRSVGEISIASVTTAKPGTGLFSYEAVGAASTGVGVATNVNRDGVWEDLEIFTALAALTGTNIVIPVLPASQVIKSFVGPNNTLELIRFNNPSTVVDNVVLDLTAGHIDDIYLFGDNTSVEFNTSDPAHPATSATTNIFYGVSHGGLTATEPSSAGVNAIAFLEFNSAVGNITVTDINPANAIPANVGPVLVGYVVSENGASDEAALGTYINNPNRSGVGQTVPVTTGATPTIVLAGIGNISVDGSLGGVVSSGGVGTITTNDTVAELPTGVPSANFTGLVTDGSAGAITINGNVTNCLVVGDPVVTGLGPDKLLNTADDVVGISGTPSFGGDITVTGNLGTTAHWVSPNTNFTRPGGQMIQSPQTGAYTATYSDNAETIPNLAGQIANMGSAYSANQVSAPDGIAVNITVGGTIKTAIISGKRIVVDQKEDQTNDSITGNIIAGLTGAVHTGGDINGDIWSGEAIGAPGGGTVIQAFASTVNGAFGAGGNIKGVAGNDSVLVYATGGSAGDITSNILADADIQDIHIIAGSGSGGSLKANVVAGLDPLYLPGVGGGIKESLSFNEILADNDIGSGNTNVVSSAGSMKWTTVSAGNESDKVAFGGNVNSDFLAGVRVGDTTPLQVNINDSTLPVFQNQGDSITITTLQAGWTQDGVNQDGNATNDLNSNLNGTLVAAGNITVTNLQIDGNATGNDGVAGGHIAAAGMGFKAASTFGAGANTLTIGTGSKITGDLNGTFSAGMFVPANTAANSPINPADAGPMAAGTVLTLGNVSIAGLTVGRWVQGATGNNDGNGVTLGELLSGAETGADTSFAPVFSIGATENIAATINVIGRPIIPPVIVSSVESNQATATGGIASDGDATNVSIAAFGNVGGAITASNKAQFNFVMSNIDAVIARNSSNANPTTPSNASLFLPLNSGQAGNNSLNITAKGFGTGGLDIEFDTAGYDYFNQVATGSFLGSFGLGSLSGTLNAQDATPSNGLSVGVLSFAFVGAGQDVSGNLIASGNIVTRLSSATTDGSALFPNSQDADAVAGLSASNVFNPNPVGGAALFPGGNYSGKVVAGASVGSAAHPLTIAALGDANDATGSFTGTFALVSGAADQLASPATSSDIHATVIAANTLGGLIDAGDTQKGFGGTVGAGLGGASGVPNGAFFGTIQAGAGNDLNIFNVTDNNVDASITANIYTAGNLDVSGTGGGIYAENNISGAIKVGFGPTGGNLLGNVVAEGDIARIEVWGNVGSAAGAAVIYAGGVVTNLLIGNAPGIVGAGLNTLRPSSMYIGNSGTLYDNVYMAGQGDAIAPAAYIGGGVAAGETLTVGAMTGVTGFTLEINGVQSVYSFAQGKGAFYVTGGDTTAADIIAYDSATKAIQLNVTGNGAEAGIHRLIAGDNLDLLHVVDGSVGQIIVNDDMDIASIQNGYVAALNLAQFPFLVNSLVINNQVRQAFNNDKLPITANHINVDGNIGVTAVDAKLADPNNYTGTGADGTVSVNNGSSNGLNANKANFAVYVQGDLLGYIHSETGYIGNAVVGGSVDGTTFYGKSGIGDVWAGTGGVDTGTTFSTLGSMGVLSVPGNIDNPVFDVSENLGGLISRNGYIDQSTNEVHVHGSIGLIIASDDISGDFFAETGDIGLDLDTTDMFAAEASGITGDAATYGIVSHIGDIAVQMVAGRDIGNVYARTGSVINTIDADDYTITANGTVVNITSTAGPEAAVATNLTGSGSIVVHLTPDLGGPGAAGEDHILRAGRNIGNVKAYRDIGNYYIEAGGNIGDLAAQIGDIGATRPTVIDPLMADLAKLGLGAGGAFNTQINLGFLQVTAGGSIGNVIAGKNVGAARPVDIMVNGINVAIDSGTVSLTSGTSAAIDPVTLGYANPSAIDLGNVYATTGSIYANITTAGSVGVANPSPTANRPLIGGIAAPLGTINGSVKIGGNLGGIAARAINASPITVLGTTGLYVDPGTTLTASGGVTGNGTATLGASDLTVSLMGTTYVLHVDNATGSATYHANGDVLVFDSINLSATDPTTGVGITLTSSDANKLAQITSISITGSLANATLAAHVGSIKVSKNIGTGRDATNPLVALGVTVQIAGGFDSLVAKGLNYGLTTVAISNGQYFSFPNALSTTPGDAFATVYIGKGSATVTVNNGVVQSIVLGAGAASNLVVEADNAASVGLVTLKGGKFVPVSPATKASTKARQAISAGLAGEFIEVQKNLEPEANTIQVGTISSAGTGTVNLTNVVVDGTVASIKLSGKSTLTNAIALGDVGNVLVAGAVSGLEGRGNVGAVNSGGTLTNTKVAGNIDRVSATGNVTTLSVGGNAGIISSGATLSKVNIAGSAVQLTAATINNAAVSGSVGLAIGGTDTSSLALGQAFSTADAQRILGGDLTKIGSPGPNGSKYVGGINAKFSNAQISVGGLISELNITHDSAAPSQLVGQTVDDVFVGVAKTNAFVKKDGVLISSPTTGK
ncbi:MAG: hypothetical protein ACHRHE_03775 [Tepidisphaerales bacterium]